MKNVITTLFILLFASVYAFSQTWEVVSEPDFKVSLNDIFMISEDAGWVVGNDGVIYYTENQFEDFTEQNSDVEEDLEKAFFVDDQNGWIGTGDGSVLRTTDGGETWEVSDLHEVDIIGEDFSFSYFDGLYFVDDQLGFALAGKYKANFLFKTTDGGVTWAVKDSLTNQQTAERWNDIKFYDDQKGVVVGSKAGTQRYTTDGGETWSIGDSAVVTNFNDGSVEWLNENEVVYTGQGNSFFGAPLPVFKSTDGGQTWTEMTDMENPVYDRVNGLYFKDDQNGIAVGDNGFSKMFIYKTADGGETWTESMGSYSLGLKALSGLGDILYALCSGSHIVKSTDFGETWEIFPIKTPSSFADIQYTGNTGFALGSYSDLLVDQDGSVENWEYTASCGLWNAGAVHFFNADEGIVVKENRHIVKTTNGGESWYSVLDPVEFSTRNKVGGVSFVDDNTGYVWISLEDYADYRVLKTTDAGENWEEIAQIEGPGYLSGGIAFFDEDNGFIAGPRHKPDTVYLPWVQYTTDGGETWNEAELNGLPDNLEYDSFDDIAKVDENNAFIAGGNNFFKTSDKGQTWDYVDHQVADIDTNFYSLAFNGDYGVLGTFYGAVVYTEDGGETWNKYEEFVDQFRFYAAEVTDNGDFVLGTSDGYIAAYLQPVDVQDENLTVDNFALSQNYPNPFNPETTIKFDVPKQSRIKISVYNTIGQKVETLVDANYKPGSYKVNFNALNYSSGVYFYKLEAGDNVNITKKMILIK